MESDEGGGGSSGWRGRGGFPAGKREYEECTEQGKKYRTEEK